MSQQPNWRTLLPHGILEQTGVLLWLLGVLVIALRFALIVVAPTFRAVLDTSATAFYWGAVAIALGCLGGALAVRFRPGSRLAAAGSLWISRLAAVAVECLIAATIMQTALRWSADDRMPLPLVALLLLIAAIHIGLSVYHEHHPAVARAAARSR